MCFILFIDSHIDLDKKCDELIEEIATPPRKRKTQIDLDKKCDELIEDIATPPRKKKNANWKKRKEGSNFLYKVNGISFLNILVFYIFVFKTVNKTIRLLMLSGEFLSSDKTFNHNVNSICKYNNIYFLGSTSMFVRPWKGK